MPTCQSSPELRFQCLIELLLIDIQISKQALKNKTKNQTHNYLKLCAYVRVSVGVCSLKALEQSGTQQPGGEARGFGYGAAINLGRGKGGNHRRDGEILVQMGKDLPLGSSIG